MLKHCPDNSLARRSRGVNRGWVRLVCLFVTACAMAGLTVVSAAAARAPRHVRASHGLAQLLFEHHVERRSNDGARPAPPRVGPQLARLYARPVIARYGEIEYC
jgi:hypothetical protein